MSTAPQAILDDVERFQHNIEHYHRPGYNETQARVEFIDPFFVALGWDVHNWAGAAPRYRDVVHEATIHQIDAASSNAGAWCTSYTG